MIEAKSLTISQLVKNCQAEAERYKQDGQSDEAFCLELFRRALVERNEAAWEAIYTQYQQLVAGWVRNYSRFPQTEEEAAFFINGAFIRLLQSGSKPRTAEKLDSLGKCLRYLKLCVGSEIEDYLRKKKKDALAMATALDNYSLSGVAAKGQEAYPLSPDELRELLWETVQDERERLVAEESWGYGLAPRQIQARYPKTFTTVKEVSQVKRNILKRLQRKLKNRK